MPRFASRLVLLGLSAGLGLVAACGDDDQGSPRLDATTGRDSPSSDGTPIPDQGPDTLTRADGSPAETGAGRDAELADATSVPDGGAGVDVGPSAVDAQALDSGTASDAGTAGEVPPSLPATIIVMPDTQYYSSSHPDVYAGQTSWIVNQLRPLHIQAVLHVGDLVDAFNNPVQWTAANTAMRALDNLVPYVVVTGNHDSDANRTTPINTYFGPASMPWISGTMTPGQIENSYALLDIGPEKWVVVALEWGPRDAAVAWADQVLKTYADRPAILVTHAYLYRNGSRYDITVSGFDSTKASYQYFIPQSYGYTATQGINDGEMLWQKLVLPNRNVRMVFSGHDTGWARLTSTRPDGSRVHQMLSDYQWWSADDSHPDFGFGWLRIVQLDYGKRTINVRTYSPYLQQYLSDGDNQFALDWNL
jgi:hypothetical protein